MKFKVGDEIKDDTSPKEWSGIRITKIIKYKYHYRYLYGGENYGSCSIDFIDKSHNHIVPEYIPKEQAERYNRLKNGL